jgi:beta-phosphoglucomutase-like phosphatase (HAD superfamily)
VFDAFMVEHAQRHHRPFVAFDPRHDYEELVAGRSRGEGIRAFLASRGIDLPEGSPSDAAGVETVCGLGNKKNALLRRHLALHGVAAVVGSHSYLEAARMAHLRRAVVSPSANTGAILEQAGLARLVEILVDGRAMAAEQLEAKPAPDLLLVACRELRVDPSRAVAFEISPVGVAAARAAGFAFVVGVAGSGEPGVLRASDADVVVTDLAQLLAVG